MEDDRNAEDPACARQSGAWRSAGADDLAIGEEPDRPHPVLRLKRLAEHTRRNDGRGVARGSGRVVGERRGDGSSVNGHGVNLPRPGVRVQNEAARGQAFWCGSATWQVRAKVLRRSTRGWWNPATVRVARSAPGFFEGYVASADSTRKYV